VPVCILTLTILHANLIFPAPYYIVICGLTGCTFFSTLSHKENDFRKNISEQKTVF